MTSSVIDKGIPLISPKDLSRLRMGGCVASRSFVHLLSGLGCKMGERTGSRVVERVFCFKNQSSVHRVNLTNSNYRKNKGLCNYSVSRFFVMSRDFYILSRSSLLPCVH